MATVEWPRELGDGLVLRRATADDAEALAAFNERVFGADEPDLQAGIWTRDLLRGDHPLQDDLLTVLVEDRATGAIVSSTMLIPQTWTYGGIPFGVGRPELVGTDPDYRRRGLVRAQMEVVHAWSAARGHLLQGLTGIPYYYRQFGYEPALIAGGARTCARWAVPELDDGEVEPFRVRRATDDDVPLAVELYEQEAGRCLVACVRDAAIWRYEMNDRDPRSDYWQATRVIEDAAGDPVGLLAHEGVVSGGALYAIVYELKQGVSWAGVSPSVLRYLRAVGDEYAARDGERLEAIGFQEVPEHPLCQVMADTLSRIGPPFAWYLRVADLAAFITHVAPALERRVAESALRGYSGELKLSFYRDGLRLAFDGGRLVGVAQWQPVVEGWGDATFPDLTFLQLLFGSRELDELEGAHWECRGGRDEKRLLVKTLFPKRSSNVWPVA